MANDVVVDKGRRRFLTATTSVVGGAGVVLAAIPSAAAKSAGAPVFVDQTDLSAALTLKADTSYLPPGTGAVTRTLSGKVTETISVLDFIPVAQHAAIRNFTSTYDCTAGIQAAIDYAIYGGGHRRVYIPGGVYHTSSTIHLGYGEAYHSVVLEGDGYSYLAEAGFSGTGIICGFSNAPAFNFQGGRGSVVRGLWVVGQNLDWITSHQLGSFTPTLDDTLGASWVDRGLDSRADSRYAPYAAFSVDAYSGTRPATSYPDVAYPAFLGAVSQYNKDYSSDCLIEDVGIAGFVVGLVNQPCDADGNGDFTVLRRVNITYCKYGVSVGNTQSRNVHLDDVKLDSIFTVLTNRRHGRCTGKFGGAICNLSMGRTINVIDFGTAGEAGPITFINLYAEALWRIGDVQSLTSVECSIIFQSCGFSFNLQNDSRGVPATVLGGGQQRSDFQFIGCHFGIFPSVLGFGQTGVKMDGSLLDSTLSRGTFTAEYLATAHNALAGGFVPHALTSYQCKQRIAFTPRNLDTLATAGSSTATDGYLTSSRPYCIPACIEFASAQNEPYSDRVQMPGHVGIVSKTGVTGCALINKTLTVTYPGRADWQFNTLGPDAGDVLWDDLTGMTFFVRARTGTTITAEAQNNYKSDGAGGFVPIISFSPTTGNFYFINARLYTPIYYLRGDVSTSSPIITNCARDDGYVAWFNAAISVGDCLYVRDTQDRFFGPNNTKITNVNQSAGTITLSADGSRNQLVKRLDVFVRKPPANV
jgi:hypothetical protein